MFDRNVIYIQRRQRSLKPININSVLVIFSVYFFCGKLAIYVEQSPHSGKTEWSGYYHSNKSDGYHLHTFLAQSETDNWANH